MKSPKRCADRPVCFAQVLMKFDKVNGLREKQLEFCLRHTYGTECKKICTVIKAYSSPSFYLPPPHSSLKSSAVVLSAQI